MTNIESKISFLYKKFGRFVSENSETIKNFLSVNFDPEIFNCDDFFDFSKFPADLLKELSSIALKNGEKEKSEWLDPIIKGKPQEKAQKVFFLWLDDKIKEEIGSLSLMQRKTLFRTINNICFNPEILSRNYSDVGFVKQGVEELRDFKRHGKGGYRIYFTLMPDKTHCVIIGKSDGKSTTDVTDEEVNKFIKLAQNVQGSDCSKMEEVSTIIESVVAICFKRKKIDENVILESIDDDLYDFYSTIDGEDVVCFVDENSNSIDKNEFVNGILKKIGNQNITIDDVLGFLIF